MTTVQKLLSSWHKLILNGQIETAYEQLKSEVTTQKWTIEQENKMANYCLVTTNMKAYEFLKSNVKDQSTAQQIFRMTDFCCRIIEKTWQCKVTDFLGSLRVICQYFLASDSVYEALVISQYRMEFVHIHNERESSKDNSKMTDDMALLYLHHLIKMPMNDLEGMLDIWKFVLSPKVIELAGSNISSILSAFGNFCSKANSTEGVRSSLLIMWYLSEIPWVNFTEKDIDSFVNICQILIRYSKTDQLKKTISKLICCIERAMLLYCSGELLAIPFCCDILRFSVCCCDSSKPSILVDNCYKGLNAVSSASSMLRNCAVNFARVVLIHAQNYWSNGENFVYRKCLPNVFVFFTRLSEVLKRIEINQNNANEKKYTTISTLALLITNRVPDLTSEELISIYFYVKQCLSILLETYDDDCGVDNAQKTQLYYNTGVHSFNVGCFYMKAKLYSECEELSLMAIEKIAALPNDVILNCSVQSYVEKLAICLYQSQRYESALRTTCIWAAKLPQTRTVFMNRYGSFKAKIFYENRDSHVELMNKTCWDLIKEDQQKNSAFWEKINFTDRDIMVLLKLELKQCLTYQIHSVDLLEKIIEQGTQRNDITKIELFILGGLIFTQSSDYLSNAMKLLPSIENNIERLNQKMMKKDIRGNAVHYSTILGSLHYVKFRIKLLNARCENEKEVAFTTSMKPLPAEPGMEQEARDDSDIMHKYLYYKSQQEFISLLDAAVDCWFRAINEVTNEMGQGLREKSSEIREDIDIPTLIKETALMYRLYCAESKEIRAWKLFYSLAVIREEDEMIVYALSNLVSLNTPMDPEWEAKVEEKLPTVEKITRVNYQLETIRKLFINGRGIEGVTILSQISEEDTNSNVVVAAKYNFVMSQYILAGFFNVSDYPLLTAMRAFYLLIPCIKRNSWKNLWEASEIQSLLLDVTSYILQFHVAAFQTNFIKTYLDKAVYLIKKLGLPLRTCKVLTILCTVGVITCETEDIYVKLNSLKSVLKFDEGVKEEEHDKEHPVKTAATLSPSNFSSNTDVRFVSNFEDNYASPILETGLKYDWPEFVDHKSECECAICDDVHYQQISCELMSLFGSYMWLLGSPHCGQALSHFDSALKMCSRLRNRWKGTDHAKENVFLKTQIITKMRLGDFWASNDKFEEAWELNKEAIQEYENLIVPDEALRSQLIDQCLDLEYVKLRAGIKSDLPMKEPLRKKLNFGSIAAKTPSCKTTVTVFEDEQESSRLTKLMENMAITPLPKHCRKLLFKEPTTSTRATRNRNKKDANTPPDIVMLTPSSLRSNKRTILEGKFPSSDVVKDNGGLFTSPSEPTVSSRRTRNRSKTRERPLDSVGQTSTSRKPTRTRNPLKDKLTSSVDENDVTPSTDDSQPVASGSSTLRVKSDKKYPALGVIKQIPSSSRTRSQKTAANKVSSSCAESSSRQSKRKN